MKLCKDCRHFKPACRCGFCLSQDICRAREAGVDPEFDPVTGREVKPVNDPREMRLKDGQCGQEARLFEERHSLLKRLIG